MRDKVQFLVKSVATSPIGAERETFTPQTPILWGQFSEKSGKRRSLGEGRTEYPRTSSVLVPPTAWAVEGNRVKVNNRRTYDIVHIRESFGFHVLELQEVVR
jgi:hypothetical protein